VFFTDSRTAQQCDTCSQNRIIAVDALEQAVVRLYSPAAGGQIVPRDLTSYSFQDLNNLLEAGIGESEVEVSLRQAEWIVVLTLEENPDIPSSSALRKFLEARPELYRDKKLVVFAMNAPYYLDATEISKLSAYYALYSRSHEFIEIVARLLFQEIQPTGDLPVSMPGIGYDLNQITFPDVNQTIPLVIETVDGEVTGTTPTPETTPVVLTYRLGDLIDLRAGVIVDHNGRIVPDGTIVKFIITQGGEVGTRRQIEAQTVQGLARVTVRIDSPGNLEFRAESDPAKRSDILQIVVPMENMTETPEPTATQTPTGTLEPTLTSTPTPTVVLQSTPIPEEPKQTGFGGWMTSLVITSLVGMASFWVGRREGQLRWGVRTGLLVLIGGTLAYTYLALALPGSQNVLEQNQLAGLVIVAVLGGSVGWLASLVWKQLT
jgi:beta-N-acetylhexosaminidase